jgi:hypothetical protein
MIRLEKYLLDLRTFPADAALGFRREASSSRASLAAIN